MNNINAITVKDLFWLRFKRDLNFGFQGLPSDLHFTISRHPNSSDVNLHISKNTSGIGRKPMIKIAVMDKQLFKDFEEMLYQTLGAFLFESVNIKLIKKRYPDLRFADVSREENVKAI